MNRPWDEDDKDRDRCLMFRPVNEKLAPIIRIPLSSGHNSFGMLKRIRPEGEKERCSGSFHLAVGFLVIKDDSISERLG